LGDLCGYGCQIAADAINLMTSVIMGCGTDLRMGINPIKRGNDHKKRIFLHGGVMDDIQWQDRPDEQRSS